MMALDVSFDAAAKEIIAKLAAEHPQDPASLWISEVIEHFIWRIDPAADDGIGIVQRAAPVQIGPIVEHGNIAKTPPAQRGAMIGGVGAGIVADLVPGTKQAP